MRRLLRLIFRRRRADRVLLPAAVVLLTAACGQVAFAQSGGISGADGAIKVFAGVEEDLPSAGGNATNPFAVVVGKQPIYFGTSHPFDLRGSARFGGATGSTVDLSNIQTFHALDFDGRLERSLSDASEPTQLLVGVDVGYQYTIPATPQPLVQGSLRAYGYLTLQTKGAGAVSAGFGQTQELSVPVSSVVGPAWHWAGFADARVPLQGPNGLFWLGGRLVKGSAAISDSLQLYVAVATKNITISSQAP